jgi:ectoine hydroxylase-related dioxygenase (phytanoyl-CoA dioxygenase family)
MEVNYGQVSHFDGANSLHGNKDNLTGKSRMSIDFRIFPIKYYNQQDQEQTETLTQKKKFVIGEYWSEL